MIIFYFLLKSLLISIQKSPRNLKDKIKFCLIILCQIIYFYFIKLIELIL